MYLYQSIDLKKPGKEELPVYLNLHYFKFEKDGKIGDLTKAESFALWDYLREGKRVEQDFEASMNLGFAGNYIWVPSHNEINDPYNIKDEEKVSQIETDGRLFKFRLADNDSLTIDIGFNFFRNNKNRLHFRDRKEYEY